MDATQMIDWLKAHPEVTSLRAAVCDLNGALRGKRLPSGRAASVLGGGMRIPLSVTGIDVWGEDIVGGKLVFETGDADGICEWTGRGPLPIGWTAQPTALIPGGSPRTTARLSPATRGGRWRRWSPGTPRSA